MKRAFLIALALSATASAAPMSVGLVLDAGGKNDRSFNQAAWEGAQRAAKDFGVNVDLYEQKNNAQNQGAAQYADQGKQLIIGVGFANQEQITKAAAGHQAQKFAVVDDLPSGPNTTGMRFREEEGSFMVGYIAGRSTSTKIVAFLGGMRIPQIKKFEAGYTAGVKAACPDCKVLSNYVGNTPAAWNDPVTGQRMGKEFVKQGADIVYTAAGGSGRGVINFMRSKTCVKATELPSGVRFNSDVFRNVPKSQNYQAACAGDARPLFYIGVDSNQNFLGDDDNNPATLNYGLTSMVKRVDNAVYSLIKDTVQGKAWRSGDRMFALENDGVGYALDEYNRDLIPAALQKQLDAVKKAIVFGSIKVPRE